MMRRWWAQRGGDAAVEGQKIAFVTPWYGQIPGGMEAETRHTAERLAAAGYHVELLTTCIQSFASAWDRNYHRPGISTENGVIVRRFRVQRRNKAAFDAVNAKLMSGHSISAADETQFLQNMFRCPQLFAYIEAHRDDYIFCFIPYLFVTAISGVPLAPHNAIAIPCLHDEAYARLPSVIQSLQQARAIVLQTYAEGDLLQALAGDVAGQTRIVVGTGVEEMPTAQAGRFRQKYSQSNFILYAGRKDKGKNVPLLLNHWQRYVREQDTDLQLILIGPGDAGELPPQTTDLGFVSIQDKYDAMAAATVLVLPSVNESFSIVMMESWLAQRPVLVNGRCNVTREHCQRSNGGLYFNSYAEFAATLNYLQQHPQQATKMGQLGRQYVRTHYQWDTIIRHYETLFAKIADGRPIARRIL